MKPCSGAGAGAAPALSYETIRQWYDRPGYIRAQAKLVRQPFGGAVGSEVSVLGRVLV